MDVGDVLEQAAKMVEVPGFWSQGQTYQYEQDWIKHKPQVIAGVECSGGLVSACALGAIFLASKIVPAVDVGMVAVAASEALADFLGRYVPGWNDERGRTADEVATAMRDAARKWRIENARE